jgi:hypothetical protein
MVWKVVAEVHANVWMPVIIQTCMHQLVDTQDNRAIINIRQSEQGLV